MSNSLKHEFLLDPSVIFLNHGSFGACPRPVFETYQYWQRELERQPVEFLGRRADGLLENARLEIAEYLGTSAENLIFVTNASVGVNTVVRSLELNSGDEILTTDHEYGAMDYTWQFICKKTGAHLIYHPIPLPVPSISEVVESFWAKVTPRTKVIFISHITSPTALILPIQEIIQRAHEAGILTIIDGAHVPGQLPINLDELGADFYTGNFHKWLCAPKGAAFLFARPERHAMIDPLVISWGWGFGNTFTDQNQWQGTRDIAAFLSVPAAIEFQKQYDWTGVRQRCHQLAADTQNRLAKITGLTPLAPPQWFAQMVTIPLPVENAFDVTTRLYKQYRIEVPGVQWNKQAFFRVSFQGYNTPEDANALISALQEILDIQRG